MSSEGPVRQSQVKPIRVTSGQPFFLPWGGFWGRLMAADLMIWELSVAASDGRQDHYHNRVKVRGSWLTLPVVRSPLGTRFADLCYERWGLAKVSRGVGYAYGKKFPHRDRLMPVIDVLDNPPDGNSLAELNLALIAVMSEQLGLDGMCTVPDLQSPDPAMTKTERLVARVRRHVSGPVDYYMGGGTAGWVDHEVLMSNGIRSFVMMPVGEVPDETALQLIAQEADPRETLQRMFGWMEVSR